MGAPPSAIGVSHGTRRKILAPNRKERLVSGTKKKRKRSPARGARVDDYFKKADSVSRGVIRRLDLSTSDEEGDKEDDEGFAADAYKYLREMVERLTLENEDLKKEVGDIKAENEDLRTRVELELPEMGQRMEEVTKEGEGLKERNKNLMQALKQSLVRGAEKEREERKKKCVSDGDRLGRSVVQRSRTSLREEWHDGYEWRAVQRQIEEVQTERESLEKRRREVVKRRGILVKEAARGCDMPPPMPRREDGKYVDSAGYMTEQEEVYRVQMTLLKKRESELADRRQALVRERDVLVREVRRQNDEAASVFSEFPMLNGRYLCLSLLGRGGFSEVFKAFDFETGTWVACKIHQLASNWSEAKKRSFIRHSMREYEIHKSLDHPRVVKLVDIFEIDENTFCTVLEYCEGCDLDSYLRQHKTLSERECKSIIGQVFSGLLYLGEQRRRVIHYDLKPGNILLHKGQVQITDFGLSKIMSDTDSTVDGMELTSQGAGTMWYLPPECFDMGGKARISVKVDVWSAGVILFQMLYGRKPFGHDQTQERMFRDRTVQREELVFPARPAVSDVCKDFMKFCLTRKVAERPDVQRVVLHPFLRK